MSEKKEKVTVMKWMLPSLLLLIALAALLINFSIAGRKNAVEEVNAKLMGLAESYAGQINHEVERMTGIGAPMAPLLSYEKDGDEKEAIHIADTLVSYSDAYLVIIADSFGKGITNTGSNVDVRQEAYYIGSECEKQSYSYTNEEMVLKKQAIVSRIPIVRENKTKGVIYMFYPVERVKELFADFPLFNQSVMALSLNDGEIITKAGRSTEFLANTSNMVAFLEQTANQDKMKEVKRSMDVVGSGHILAKTENNSRHMIYVPLKINKWYVTVGVNESNVIKQVSEEWKDTRGIMIALIVILSAFVVTVLSIAIVMKIKYSQHSKNLATKADTDLLTELYNKIATEREIKDYLRCKPSAKGIMFVLDIDNFKKINDTRGHAFGDEVLKAIGVRLQTAFRVSDIVGRTGGDEFTVFLKDISDENIIEREMRKLTNVFKDFNTGEYVKYSVTASIGCAVYPDDANSFEGLYKAADSALYLAKKRGKNQIARYEKESV